MDITVVNKRTYRAMGAPWEVYIGRPSPLGNPFTSIKGRATLAEFQCDTRLESINRYAGWLQDQMFNKNSEVLAELDRLFALLLEHDKLVLICWCAPLPCHGDVLKTHFQESWKYNFPNPKEV